MRSWLAKLAGGLKKSSARISDGVAAVFTKRRLDQQMLDELEELLISADIGVDTAARLVGQLAKEKFDKDVDDGEVKAMFAAQIAATLEPVAKPLVIDKSHKPYVVLIVGVNGTGKTTTIGKLANWLKSEGHSVVLAAADTFRAAAVEQLKIWGDRNGCVVVAGEQNSDPASIAFKGFEEARKNNADVLLVDTAGRLHNKTGLMQELQKIVRVIGKNDETAPHATLLVLDATTGQNAHAQVEVFKQLVNVSGLVVTKLDGTAKGGVVVALAEKFGLPVHAIGVGEGIDDLQPFTAKEFAEALVGV